MFKPQGRFPSIFKKMVELDAEKQNILLDRNFNSIVRKLQNLFGTAKIAQQSFEKFLSHYKCTDALAMMRIKNEALQAKNEALQVKNEALQAKNEELQCALETTAYNFRCSGIFNKQEEKYVEGAPVLFMEPTW